MANSDGGEVARIVWTNKDDDIIYNYVPSQQHFRRQKREKSRFAVNEESLKNGNIVLWISEVMSSDGGIYHCTVITEEEFVTKSINLLVQGIRLVLAIRLHVSPPSLTCDVGQTAQFKCTIDDCFDNASFFWYQKHIFGNGTEGELKSINIGRKFSVNKTKLASTLVIEAVEIADAGPFICKVLCFQKKMVYANKTSLLVVKALPKLHLHTQISADDPSIVTLICSAVDFYPPSIIFIWDHSLPGVLNGSEQTEPTLLQQGTYSSNSSLQVRTSQWTPGTEIACVVNHSSVTQPLREGIWRRVAFEMTCQPVFLQTDVGSNVSITCSWQSQRNSADRKIMWTKDDIFLESQPPLEHQSNSTVTDRFKFNYQNMDNRNVSLNIKNLQRSDAGTYECTVIIGEAYREMKINLQVRDKDEKYGKNVEESDTNNKYDIILKDMPRQHGFFLSLANDVILTPKSTVRLIGQRVEFQCRLKKEKDCKTILFFWRHIPIFENDSETVGKDIENGGRFSINNEGQVSSLVITDVKITDSGYFNCSLICVHIKKESLCEGSQLEVQAVPKLTLHYQTSSDDPSNLHLTCSAVGFYPPSITLSWDHTFHEVNHSILRGDPTLLQDGTYNISSTLLVKASLWSPGDEIGCVVNHSSLTRPLRKNIMREGVFLSLADDLLLTPQSATRLIGQRLELNCSLNKEKNCKRPQFFWRHRHIHLNSSEEAEKDIRGKGRFSISTESLSSSLVITDLKVTDSGYFNCSVLCMTIKKEFIWKSSQLEMRAVPKLDLHYQTSSENPNILHLTCSAVGFYPPNITLFWDHSLHEVTHSILPDNPTLLQDGTYNISSILHVKTSLWSPGEEIGCVVNHSSLTRPLRKNITREVPYKVECPSPQIAFPNMNTLINCTIKNLNSDTLTYVFWTKDHNILASYRRTKTEVTPVQQSRFSLSQDTISQGDFSLYIMDVQPSDNGLYRYSLGINNTREDGEVMLEIRETPSLHLQFNLSSNNPEDLILTCSAVGFYSSDFTLSWHHSLPEVLYATQQDAHPALQVGTYSRSSTLLVTKTLWAPGTEIGCEANHTSLRRPLKKYIRSPLEKGIATGAIFQIIQSPTFLQLYVGDTAVIHCSLLGCAVRRYFWNKTTECENRTHDLFNSSRISISVSGTIRVENVTGSDSGLYYCRVIHRCLKQSPGTIRGNGTRLMVMDAAKSRDKRNKEEEEKELQYSTLAHKNLKKCSFTKNENELNCIYTQVKPKGDSMAKYEDCVDYAVLDMHETPAAATVANPDCSQYSSLASTLQI
ncbi:NR3L1 protein, partial [Polypterus senegalus]